MTQTLPEASPENFVLAQAIAAVQAERHILTTLGTHKNGAGSLPALRTVRRAVAAAAARHPSDRATAWVGIFGELADRVASWAPVAPWLEMRCPLVGHRSVCDLLADPVRSFLLPEARQRLDAWLGIHVFNALARGGVVSAAVLDDWETLRRTGTPRTNTAASWVNAAKCMPLDDSEIRNVLSTTRNERLRDALKLTLVALAADIPAPETLVESGASELQGDFGSSHPTGVDPNQDDTGDDGEDGDEPESKNSSNAMGHHSLVGLLLHRALHSGYRAQFGVTSVYGELPMPNLRRACTALVSTLNSGSEADRTRAAFAEVSLKVPLSPRRTLGLPLECNDDIWIDLPARSIFWNFDRVLETRECDPSGADHRGRCKPVRIRLSDGCIRRLSHLLALRGSAATLGELAGASDDLLSTNEWLKAYGVFLREHGDSNYKAYSVRFARSYRSAYLERRHGAVAAAMLGLDFATVPAGMLHYVSLYQEQLTAWQMDVDGYLGLQWAAGTTGMVC